MCEKKSNEIKQKARLVEVTTRLYAIVCKDHIINVIIEANGEEVKVKPMPNIAYECCYCGKQGEYSVSYKSMEFKQA